MGANNKYHTYRNSNQNKSQSNFFIIEACLYQKMLYQYDTPTVINQNTLANINPTIPPKYGPISNYPNIGNNDNTYIIYN